MGRGAITRTQRLVQVPGFQSHGREGMPTKIYFNQLTESLNLCLHKWELASHNGKHYPPLSIALPQIALPRIREQKKKPKTFPSKPHCAKAFANNLSILPSTKKDHQSILDSINQHCTSLALAWKPSKCL